MKGFKLRSPVQPGFTQLSIHHRDLAFHAKVRLYQAPPKPFLTGGFFGHQGISLELPLTLSALRTCKEKG